MQPKQKAPLSLWTSLSGNWLQIFISLCFCANFKSCHVLKQPESDPLSRPTESLPYASCVLGTRNIKIFMMPFLPGRDGWVKGPQKCR